MLDERFNNPMLQDKTKLCKQLKLYIIITPNLISNSSNHLNYIVTYVYISFWKNSSSTTMYLKKELLKDIILFNLTAANDIDWKQS